jgi:hypothetical protein
MSFVRLCGAIAACSLVLEGCAATAVDGSEPNSVASSSQAMCAVGTAPPTDVVTTIGDSLYEDPNPPTYWGAEIVGTEVTSPNGYGYNCANDWVVGVTAATAGFTTSVSSDVSWIHDAATCTGTSMTVDEFILPTSSRVFVFPPSWTLSTHSTRGVWTPPVTIMAYTVPGRCTLGLEVPAPTGILLRVSGIELGMRATMANGWTLPMSLVIGSQILKHG